MKKMCCSPSIVKLLCLMGQKKGKKKLQQTVCCVTCPLSPKPVYMPCKVKQRLILLCGNLNKLVFGLHKHRKVDFFWLGDDSDFATVGELMHLLSLVLSKLNKWQTRPVDTTSAQRRLLSHHLCGSYLQHTSVLSVLLQGNPGCDM